MSAPDNPPPGSNGSSEPLRGPDYMNVVDKIVGPDGWEKVPPGQGPRVPIELPVSKEELVQLFYTVQDKVVWIDGPADTTKRPPRPDFKPFWPEDLPLPKPPCPG